MNSPMKEDPEVVALIERVIEGDTQAFGELDSRFRKGVSHWIGRKIGDRCTVEDLTQEVFIKAWEKREGFRGLSLYKNWLIGIANNLIKNAHRKRATERQHFRRLPDVAVKQFPSNRTDPHQQLEQAEMCKGVRDSLSALPTKQRETMEDDIVHHQKPKETADRLGVPPKSINTRRFDGKKTLWAMESFRRLARLYLGLNI